MASAGMVLKCAKTGKILFNAEEAQEHAEAFGKDYANFDEVSLDAKIWVCVETKRPCFTEQEMNNYKRRDPDAKTFEEKTIQYLVDVQKEKQKVLERKNKFFDSVNQKWFTALSEVKGYGQIRAAKGLHFSGNKSLEAAEAWINEHLGDPDIDKLDEDLIQSVVGDVEMDDGSAPMEVDEPDDRKPGDPNPPEVKEKVNQDMLKEVMEMGFSELKAEKALFLTDNQGVQFAINWLGDHGEDADIELPLKKPKPKPPPPPEKPKMSKEEAQAKAAELQKQIKERKAAQEVADAKEKEKNRVASTKMMQETQAKLEEDERKRELEKQRREKEAHEKHRADLKEKLRLDYIERFGCEPPDEELEKEKGIKEKPLREQMLYYLNKMKKDHKDTNPAGLKTCLSTVRIYINNLKENPQDPKFKVLKIENKAFQSRVAPIEGVMELLETLGFENKGETLEQKKGIPDGFICGEALKFIDLILRQI